jgi:group I intron endonuclease
MIGIYCIENKTTQKKYIGKSIDIFRRWNEHLEQGKYSTSIDDEFHFNLYHNSNNFTFSIIELCEEEELSDKEKYYIEKYDTINNGYNKIAAAQNIFDSKKALPPSKKEIIRMITSLLEKPLFKEDKDQLSQFFKIKDKRGNILKWNTVKKEIISKGFDVVESKRYVDGKMRNCSIIRLRWED